MFTDIFGFFLLYVLRLFSVATSLPETPISSSQCHMYSRTILNLILHYYYYYYMYIWNLVEFYMALFFSISRPIRSHITITIVTLNLFYIVAICDIETSIKCFPSPVPGFLKTKFLHKIIIN